MRGLIWKLQLPNILINMLFPSRDRGLPGRLGPAFTSLHYFLLLVGAILIITGIAKLYSAGHSEAVYKEMEPLFGVSFRLLFLATGTIELSAGFFCVICRRLTPRVAIVGALGSAFAIYRTGLWLIQYKKPCSCLGELTDALGLSPRIADGILISIVALMLAIGLIGFYLTSPKVVRSLCTPKA